jgi:CubicO group peptidase (beta-lactamase class C family)
MQLIEANVFDKSSPRGGPMRKSQFFWMSLVTLLALGACSDGPKPASNPFLPVYDFSAVDERFQRFVDESDIAEGVSLVIVDRDQGTVHEAAYGDHPENIVTLLAAVSMFTTVSTVMALDEDEAVDFDINDPIANYLPWEGVYGSVTTAQMMSNTSGIPGVYSFSAYTVHGCQYDSEYVGEECSKLIYETLAPDTNPPGTVFDYGGSQWHLAGAVASQVKNSDWNQVFNEYVAEPCELEVYRYGNMSGDSALHFTGHPDSLIGTGNPHAGGGGMSSVRDMAKLLLLHLRDGMCGDNRVLSVDAVQAMRENRTEGLPNENFPGASYGMGWWERDDLLDGVIYDSGGFGSIAWIDTQTNVGGYIAVDDYAREDPYEYLDLVWFEIIPMVRELVDQARL